MPNLQQIPIKICVYKITNPKKKVYIGSTINFKHRVASYRRLDCRKQHRLYNSLKKYGFDKHKFEILCECSLEDVRKKEAYYGQLYSSLGRNGLNCFLPKHGEGFVCVSDEWRKNMGATKKGNKNCLGRKNSPESKKRMSEAQKLRDRKPHALKTRLKMRESALGGNNHKAKILLNTQTGIYYECVMDAANSYSMNYNYFRSKLYNHRNKNDTPFIYV